MYVLTYLKILSKIDVFIKAYNLSQFLLSIIHIETKLQVTEYKT